MNTKSNGRSVSSRPAKRTKTPSATPGWIDISVPVQKGMVHWPGDPAPKLKLVSKIRKGADANVTLCRFSAHTGTHMDAPCHFIDGQAGIDQFPLSLSNGRVRIIALSPKIKKIGRTQLQDKNLGKGECIFFKTANSAARWSQSDFKPDYVAIDASGASFLAEAGIALVGVDYLSVGLFESDGVETHRTLLGAGIWVVEGLDLADVIEGTYDYICLPLRLIGSDGSPARVIVQATALG